MTQIQMHKKIIIYLALPSNNFCANSMGLLCPDIITPEIELL
jgi:hypothetical protein